MSTEDNVIRPPFPASEQVTPEEHSRRVLVEVQRLCGLAPDEWRIWYKRSAVEQLKIEPDDLKLMIEAELRTREKKVQAEAAQKRLQEQRADRERNLKKSAAANSSASRMLPHARPRENRRRSPTLSSCRLTNTKAGSLNWPGSETRTSPRRVRNLPITVPPKRRAAVVRRRSGATSSLGPSQSPPQCCCKNSSPASASTSRRSRTRCWLSRCGP
jgi:hypothetical protein